MQQLTSADSWSCEARSSSMQIACDIHTSLVQTSVGSQRHASAEKKILPSFRHRMSCAVMFRLPAPLSHHASWPHRAVSVQSRNSRCSLSWSPGPVSEAILDISRAYHRARSVFSPTLCYAMPCARSNRRFDTGGPLGPVLGRAGAVPTDDMPCHAMSIRVHVWAGRI